MAKFYEGIPEVIEHTIVRAVVEHGLQNCQCSATMDELASDLSILWGTPDERKVTRKIELAKERLEHDEGSFHSTIKGTKCTVPFGSSAQEYLEKLVKQDWVEANASLADYIKNIRIEAGNKRITACKALALLVRALEAREGGG